MFTPMEVILVCAWTWLMIGFIGFSVQIFSYGAAVLHGFVTGLIMGDPTMGLTVGGTLCLMSLGVVGLGGASVPDYMIGTIVGTVFAVGTNGGLEAGLAVGIPTAALGTQFDIVSKMCGSFFIHREMECAEKKQFNKMGLWAHGWNAFRATLYTLPVLLVMTVGSGLIESLLTNMPEWLISGLNTAAGMLPAVGFAILLRYLPLKDYGVYAIFGFAAAAYLHLSVLAITLLSLVFVFMTYKSLEDKSNGVQAQVANGGDYDE